MAYSTAITNIVQALTVSWLAGGSMSFAGGALTINPAVRTIGSASYFTVTAPADTGVTTATESVGVSFTGSTRTWADGTVAVQREHVIAAPTYNKTTTSATFTKAATFAISAAPIAGAGVTITNPYALWVQAGSAQFDGGVSTTTLTASSTVSGAGITSLFASPPQIGSTTACAAIYATEIKASGPGTGGLASIRTDANMSAVTGFTNTNTVGNTGFTASGVDATLASAAVGANNAGARVKLTNTDTTNGNFCAIGNTNAAGTTSASIFFVQDDYTNNAGSVWIVPRVASGSIGTTAKFYPNVTSLFSTLSVAPAARTSGTSAYFTVTTPADTGITTATESIGVNFSTGARKWVDGTVATQREFVIAAPTYNKTTTSATFTQAATVAITAAPIAGTGVTITNAYALWVQSGLTQLDGGLAVTGLIQSNADTGGTGLVVLGRASDDMAWGPLAKNHAGSAYLGGLQFTSSAVNVAVGSGLGVVGAFSTTGLAVTGAMSATDTYTGGKSVAGNWDGVVLTNVNAGTTARISSTLSNGTDQMILGVTGTGYTGSLLTGSPAGAGGYLWTNTTKPFTIGVNSVAVGVFATTGLTIGGVQFDTGNSLNVRGSTAGISIYNSVAGSSNNWSTIRNTDTASSSNLVFTTGGGVSLTLNHDKSAAFTDNVTVASTRASGTSLTIGNVGSSVTDTALIFRNGSTKYGWHIGAQFNVDNGLDFTPSTAVGGTTFSTPVMSLTTTGLGVGTTATNAGLEVTKYVASGGWNYGLRLSDSVNATILMGVKSGHAILQTDAASLDFAASSVIYASLTSTGLAVTGGASGASGTGTFNVNTASSIASVSSRIGFDGTANNALYLSTNVNGVWKYNTGSLDAMQLALNTGTTGDSAFNFNIASGSGKSAGDAITFTTPLSVAITGLTVTGTLSTTADITVGGNSGDHYIDVKGTDTAGNGATFRAWRNANVVASIGAYASWGGGSGNDLLIRSPVASSAMHFVINNTEYAYLNTAGFTVTGKITQSGTESITLDYQSRAIAQIGGTSASYPAIRNDGSTVLGVTLADQSLYTSIKATTFTNSSDRRIKLNIRDFTDSGALMDALQPRIFDIDTTKPMHGNGKKDRLGFVAQELYPIYEQAVVKGDDGEEIVNEWGVDCAQLVPILVAELKSLRARLAAAGL